MSHMVRRRSIRTTAWTTRAIRLGLVALALVTLPLSARAGEPLTTSLVANGLSSPTYIAHAPGDAERLFVLERSGRVRLILGGQLQSTPFLDLTALVATSGEGGLLGLAFHPDYERSGKLYVHYTAPGPVSTVAEYLVSENDPDAGNPASAKVVLTLPQPTTIHKAGWIGFSPVDGYLYALFGDGGGSATQFKAQDITDELLGKLVRIDVNGDDFPADPGRNYAIPPGNPFVGVEGDDEIWGFGLRNPYRASFDRETGDLWIGDVGGSVREEVDFQPASSTGGENYGWGCMEGITCNASYCVCNGPTLTLPVHDYAHGDGNCVVTAGTVYRGCAIPDLVGTYFFADFCSGRIWSFRYDGGAITEFQDRTIELDPPTSTINSIVAIGEDVFGELYFVDLGGEIFKLVPATAPADLNRNGLADSCEPGDIDGDGSVGFNDFTALLLAWGPCSMCIEDIDGNGVVGFSDLVELLLHWG